MSLRQLPEQALIAKLIGVLPKPPDFVALPPGDDAAAWDLQPPAGGRALAVASTDMLVENVDFSWQWASAADVGHKAAAVNLSDLAAMGAVPQGLLLALALPPGAQLAEAVALQKSFAACARRYGAAVLGGDVSKTKGPWVISVTALGALRQRRCAQNLASLQQRGGRVGDMVYVSGTLGAAALGLYGLQHGLRLPGAITARQLRPQPRVALGQALLQLGIRTACDVSDGVLTDCLALPQPGCGVTLAVAHLPLAKQVRSLAAKAGLDATLLALSGGEDFELLFCAPARFAQPLAQLSQRLGIALTAIGEISAKPGLFGIPPALLRQAQRAQFSHFG